MDKLWLIAFKDIRTRFTDRRLLLIMLAAPLAIATIIGLAFGGLGRRSSPIREIPVAVINNDQPAASGTAYGAVLVGLLTAGQLPSGTGTGLSGCPQASNGPVTASSAGSMTLSELIHGTAFDAVQARKLVADQQITSPSPASGSPEYLETAAKAAVDKGLYAAMVVIPAGFSAALASLADPRQPQTTATITVYGNAGDSLSAGIVRSVVDSITAQMVSGNIAIGATLAELSHVQPTALANLSKVDLGKLFVCAFNPGTALVKMSDQPVQAAPNTLAGTLLVTFGSAQALFFAMFTAQGGVLSMYDERRNRHPPAHPGLAHAALGLPGRQAGGHAGQRAGPAHPAGAGSHAGRQYHRRAAGFHLGERCWEAGTGASGSRPGRLRAGDPPGRGAQEYRTSRHGGLRAEHWPGCAGRCVRLPTAAFRGAVLAGLLGQGCL